VLDKLGPNDRRIWSEVYGGIGLAVQRAAERGDEAAVKLSAILAGRFDVATAVQGELKRLGCYTGGLDGDWGNGSRGALKRFYDKVDVASLGEEPSLQLFNRLTKENGTVCEPVVASTPEPPRHTPSAQPASHPSTPAKPRPKPQVASEPPPAQPSKPRLTLGGAGSGTFR
jgi:hypothetical protein